MALMTGIDYDHGGTALFCILGGDHSEEFCLDWRRCRVVETENYELMSRAMKSQMKYTMQAEHWWMK